jgi:hypothetical protein
MLIVAWTFSVQLTLSETLSVRYSTFLSLKISHLALLCLSNCTEERPVGGISTRPTFICRTGSKH